MSIDLSLANVPRSSTGLIMPKGVIFYYLYDHDSSRPIGCVCFGRGKTWFCRGIAFCSMRDNFSRKIGRELAYRRYLQAVHGRKSTGTVARDLLAAWLVVQGMGDDLSKSAYKVLPTPHEAYLWDKLNKREKAHAD